MCLLQNFGYKDLSFQISRLLRVSSLCAAGHPWVSHCHLGIAEMNFGEPQASCHADLCRVALFSIAIQSLYLLHVQHFSIRSCEPSATQKTLVRLFAKLKMKKHTFRKKLF